MRGKDVPGSSNVLAIITFNTIMFCGSKMKLFLVEIPCANDSNLWTVFAIAQHVTTSISLGSLNYCASGTKLHSF